MALDKSHEKYFIPINNLKSCVAGVMAVCSVGFSGSSHPQTSFLSWNSLSRVVEAGGIWPVWEKLINDPADSGMLKFCKSVQAMLLRRLKLQSRADQTAGEHPYRQKLSQGARQARGWPGPGRAMEAKGKRRGESGSACPDRDFRKPWPFRPNMAHTAGRGGGLWDQEQHSFYTVDMHTWSIFSSFHSLRIEPSISDVSVLRSSRFSGRPWAAPPWTKAPRALLLTSLSHTCPWHCSPRGRSTRVSS